MTNRQRAGAKAKAFGNLFETLFLNRCRSCRVAVTRVPDSCRQTRNQIIRVRSPFDWIVSYAGKTALLDTKTIDGHTFPHSLIVDHQVSELLQHEAAGALGGYVIWLRTPNQIIFARASSLEKLAGVAGSIGAEDCQLLGAIETFNPREIFIPSPKTPYRLQDARKII